MNIVDDADDMAWFSSALLNDIVNRHVPVKSKFVNTWRPRQYGRRFPDDTFKRIFLNENVRILIKISLKFVPKGPINNIPALVQIMARRRSGDKPLSEPMMVSLLTHICVTRPQWVKKRLILYINAKLHKALYSQNKAGNKVRTFSKKI